MNAHPLRGRDYLGHMLDAVRQVETYIGQRGKDEFIADRLLQDAVIRNLEILGEGARSFLAAVPDAAQRFPTIPFAAIYAMRNQLSHGYFTVDLDVVWNVIELDLPDLRSQLEEAQRAFGKLEH